MSYSSVVLSKNPLAYYSMGNYGPDFTDDSLLLANLIRAAGLKNVRQVDYLNPQVAPHSGQQGGYRATLAAFPAARGVPFSCCVWVRIGGSLSQTKYLSTRVGGDFSFDMGHAASGAVTFDIGNGAGWIVTYTSPWYALHVQDWHMLTVTATATTWAFYADNAQIDTANVALGGAVLWDGTHRLTVWNRDNLNNEPFTGDMCRLSFHSRALSVGDVNDLWTAGFPGGSFSSGGPVPTPVDVTLSDILASVRKSYVAP